MRRCVLAPVMLVCLGALTGCGPSPGGSSALLLDADGTLATIVRTCDDASIDGIDVEQVVLGVGTDDITVGEVDADVGEDSAGRFSLGLRLDDLDPALSYRTFPRAESSGDRVYGVDFDVAALRALAPAHVLVGEGVAVTLEEYAEAPCQGRPWVAPTSSPGAG